MLNNYQQNPYYQQQRQFQTGLRGRPVSSIEEARAANIEFDGTPSIFPDVSNNKIYVKQLNLDGTVSFKMYQETKIPEPQPQLNTENYITREEFLAAIEQLKGSNKNLAKDTEITF